MDQPRILFLNQVAGPLFRELAEDVAQAFGGAALLTGHTAEIARAIDPALRILQAPDYNRRNLLHRGLSWLRYLLRAFRVVAASDRGEILFIVSNPPFLPLVGWLAFMVRRQRYCVLVYDLYPGVLIQLGRISPHSPVAWAWRKFNRLVWDRASIVFTIGDHMVANIRREGQGLRRLNVRMIPNWADVDFIKPIAKQENQFLRSLGWTKKTVILYSGNLGNTHNLEGLLKAAVRLRVRSEVVFLIIGAGARWEDVRKQIVLWQLDNVRLMPFQPEALLPQTLPAGDIAVVAMESAIAGYMVPSKTYYALAAGSALLALVPPDCEVADLVGLGGCGRRADPMDPADIIRALIELLDHPEELSACRERARALAVSTYSRANSQRYITALRELSNTCQPESAS